MSLETKVPDIIARAGYSELYGLDFKEDFTESHTRILNKFLVANKNDVDAAAAQLEKTLEWRKEFKPLDTINEDHGDLSKLAVLTVSPSGVVTTWNLYGAARTTEERAKLFGNLDKFLRWRVSVMERGIRLMDFTDLEKSYMDQVHDYKDVSFLRLDAATKKASSTTIELFQNYYPEFLAAKYFVNIPRLMTWVFGLVKTFMSQATADKFHVIGDGKELKFVLGEWIPKEYGGHAQSFAEIEAKEADVPDRTGNELQLETAEAAKEVQNERLEQIRAAQDPNTPDTMEDVQAVPSNHAA